MADNSAEIERIDAILSSGSKSVTVDGLMVVYDFEELRRRRAELIATNDSTLNRRSIFNRINLSRSF